MQRHAIRAKDAAILEMEMRGFFSYMEEEIHRCSNFKKVGAKLYLENGSGLVATYEKIGDRIIRRVSMEGYIILTKYVRIFQIEAGEKGCGFYIEMEKDGTVWKGNIFIGKRIERVVM
ncbi:hypothetical protein HMPREF0083_01438 [Aneurinibacillus aneurinilyticus ATCC 12856]|uniref:Uncharacterized protein n=1 Tax=Aneurinibacillus aneurinilyticus ATCC 12856 TaxID=649747 RepID=U1YEL3_ANEAE|nr:hypothetical protein HMPREF0083_01438 [Aneurinibacillus aneurinilyticus ATCC 12856]